MKKFLLTKKVIISTLIFSLLTLPIFPSLSWQETEIQKAVAPFFEICQIR